MIVGVILGPSKAWSDNSGFVFPDRVYVPIFSRHLNIDPLQFGKQRWNERNFGIYFSWEQMGPHDLDYGIGVVKNSFGEISPQVSIAKFWAGLHEDLDIGLIGTLADYKDNSRFFNTRVFSSDYVFLGGIIARYKNTFLQVLPSYDSRQRLGFVFSTGVTFQLD